MLRAELRPAAECRAVAVRRTEGVLRSRACNVAGRAARQTSVTALRRPRLRLRHRRSPALICSKSARPRSVSSGVDASREPRSCATRITPIRRRVLTPDDLGRPDYGSMWRTATASFITSSLRSGRNALRCIRRLLRPNGIFALWENNPWNPGTRLVMRRIPFDRDASLLTPASAVSCFARTASQCSGSTMLSSSLAR